MELWGLLFPFMCVLLRTLGLVLTAPVLGSRHVPGQVKALICLALSLVLWSWLPAAVVPQTLTWMAPGALCELLVGMVMGFSATLIMAALDVAGHIIDMGMGLGLAGVIDPQFGGPTPLMGLLKQLMITLIILAINGHHLFISALADSFVLMPAGSASVPQAWAILNLSAAGQMFRTALTLSAPIWAVSLVVDVALGVVARSVPQINVFVVGIPVKTLAGFFTLLAAIGFYDVFTRGLLTSVKGLLDSLLGVLIP